MKRSTTIGIAVVVVVCAGLALRPASRAQTSAAPAQQPAASARFAFGGNVAQVPAEFIGNLVFLPVRVNLPAYGPSLYLIAELTGENQAASAEFTYQQDKKAGGK